MTITPECEAELLQAVTDAMIAVSDDSWSGGACAADPEAAALVAMRFISTEREGRERAEAALSNLNQESNSTNVSWAFGAINKPSPDSKALASEYHGRAKRAEAQISALQALIAEKNAEIARLKGRGCDANNGGEHQVIAQGKYKFCHACGETIRARTTLNSTMAG